ncbi:LOW QUALITY PROTEIN: hypothetical protein PHMEG_00024981 [Phytophthora megakarya]|uniref:Reverse transcriptase n=1 Tax=Phytophthora megakarya TaxID=4795 RepID=A0A225VCR8_9STRA|nr:LOW QUALITY PROTEIN: hypothetical protein PHMEG_00024981 [Phytophthora megakarya]
MGSINQYLTPYRILSSTFERGHAGFTRVLTKDDWICATYAGARDETLFQWECEFESDEDVDDDNEWSMTPNIADPRGCVDQWSIDGGSLELARATGAQDDLPDTEPSRDRAVIGAIDDDSGVCPRRLPVDNWTDRLGVTPQTHKKHQRSEKTSEEAIVDLEPTFACVMHVLSTEGRNEPSDDNYDVHEANYISVEDYAQELAFLPDLTEPSVTVLDYEGSNVNNPALTDEQQQRLLEMLKGHE